MPLTCSLTYILLALSSKYSECESFLSLPLQLTSPKSLLFFAWIIAVTSYQMFLFQSSISSFPLSLFSVYQPGWFFKNKKTRLIVHSSAQNPPLTVHFPRSKANAAPVTSSALSSLTFCNRWLPPLECSASPTLLPGPCPAHSLCRLFPPLEGYPLIMWTTRPLTSCRRPQHLCLSLKCSLMIIFTLQPLRTLYPAALFYSHPRHL